ncbi:MAG: hypothetical protein J6Y56_00925 [Fibrobacterales bacterium]|nr:hypothetical protein [Fibrobacterales bacterium]
MRKKLLLPLLAAFAGLTVSCSDETAASWSEESKTKGHVVFDIRSLHDGSLLDSVVVVERASGTRRVSKNGRVLFEELDPGELAFVFEREGYASQWRVFSVDLDAVPTDPMIVRDDARTVRLHRTGAQFAGLVKRQRYDGTLVPEAGVRVMLHAEAEQGGFLPEVYETTTDSAGAYLFDDLPELAKVVELRTDFVVDGELLWGMDPVEDSTILLDYLGEKIVRAEPLVLEPRDADVLHPLSANWDGLAAKDTLKIRFSHPVKTAAPDLDAGSVAVYNMTDGWTEVAVVLSWSKDRKTLNVVPASGGWNVEKRNDYTIHLALTADNGSSYDSWLEFYTTYNTAALSALKGLKVDEALSENGVSSLGSKCIADTTAEVKLTWTAQPKVEYYRAAFRLVGSDDPQFVLLDSLASDVDSAFVYVNYWTTYPIESKVSKVQFAVVPCNRRECLSYEASDALTLSICKN